MTGAGGEIPANAYTNKADGHTIALAATVDLNTAADVDTAIGKCCDAATCDSETCPGIQVKKTGTLAAGTAPSATACCEDPSAGYCTDLKDGDDADTDKDTYPCGTGKFAKQLLEEETTCTGTADDATKTCDTDASTD